MLPTRSEAKIIEVCLVCAVWPRLPVHLCHGDQALYSYSGQMSQTDALRISIGANERPRTLIYDPRSVAAARIDRGPGSKGINLSMKASASLL